MNCRVGKVVEFITDRAS